MTHADEHGSYTIWIMGVLPTLTGSTFLELMIFDMQVPFRCARAA